MELATDILVCVVLGIPILGIYLMGLLSLYGLLREAWKDFRGDNDI
jgi:hypothetical protein